MANNHGGKRIGSGRKRKSTQEHVLNGTAHANEFPVLSIHGELIGEEMPKPNEYLTKQSKGVSTENRGREIYERLWNWLKDRDCHKAPYNRSANRKPVCKNSTEIPKTGSGAMGADRSKYRRAAEILC